jgi:hypothetical protein
VREGPGDVTTGLAGGEPGCADSAQSLL